MSITKKKVVVGQANDDNQYCIRMTGMTLTQLAKKRDDLFAKLQAAKGSKNEDKLYDQWVDVATSYGAVVLRHEDLSDILK